MALNFSLPSKQASDTSLETAKAALKAVAEVDRPTSPEFATVELLEKKQTLGLYNQFGQDLNAAYLRINSIQITKEGINAHVVVFADTAARQTDANVLKSFTVELPAVDSMNTNPIAFTYDLLKQNELFQGATDA